MKVACIQSSAGENYNKNFKQIIKLINQSIKNKADLIITPETTSLITSDKKILYKYTFKMSADPLIKQVKEQIIDEEFKGRCLELITNVVREEYLKMLETEIAKAFVSAYEEQAQSLFDTYLDNAEAFTTRQNLKDKITKEEREPDEKFMRSIEEQIGVTGSSKEGFRSDVTAYMFAKMRRGEKVD